MKYFVMDVDGTLTDGKIYMGPGGEAMKAFNCKDGYGIHHLLPEAGMMPVIITGRVSDIVVNRCRELGIEMIMQGVTDKVSVLKEITGNQLAQAAYVGDDLNDLPAMIAVKNAAGLVGCPADAAEEVRNIADFISKYNGGNGAVREFIEWIRKNS